MALTGSDPSRTASKCFLSASLQCQPAEPAPLQAIQNLSVPSLPFFSRCPLGGVPVNAKAAPRLFLFFQSHQMWGWRGAMLALLGTAELRLNSRRWGCRGGSTAEAGRRPMGSAVPSGQHRLPPPASLPGDVQWVACPLPAWAQGFWHRDRLCSFSPRLEALSPAQRIFF